MAKKFKDYYDSECATLLADKISSIHHDFPSLDFCQFIETQLEGKEFTQRQDLFAEALEVHMPGPYVTNIVILSEILGPELEESEGMFTHGWWLWPVGRYVQRNGLEDPKISMDFIYELTKRFTGEFAIRPLLAADPEKIMTILDEWSLDSNVHVRRLASEALRISLPWANKSRAALECFDLYQQILTNLREDPEKFVQKSVGNNLNDLMKLEPDLAWRIIDNWESQKPGKATLWIIKHGKRSLKKKS